MSPVPTILGPKVGAIFGSDLWQPYTTDTKVLGEEFVENFVLER